MSSDSEPAYQRLFGPVPVAKPVWSALSWPQMGSPAPDPATVLVAQNLAVDRTTLDVVDAMREAGIPSILLRGPALETLLYEGEVRGYVDADLLVPPDKLSRAGEMLRAQDF